jgi:hypothetical protein
VGARARAVYGADDVHRFTRAAIRGAPGAAATGLDHSDEMILLARAGATAATRARSRSSHRAGLDRVGCSPYRVPIAWLAAAQAVIAEAHP